MGTALWNEYIFPGDVLLSCNALFRIKVLVEENANWRDNFSLPLAEAILCYLDFFLRSVRTNIFYSFSKMGRAR